MLSDSVQSWLTKLRKLFHMTRRKQTVQGECIMNEQQPNSLGHEDRSERLKPPFYPNVGIHF